LTDISRWNVENVVDFGYVIPECKPLPSPSVSQTFSPLQPNPFNSFYSSEYFEYEHTTLCKVILHISKTLFK